MTVEGGLTFSFGDDRPAEAVRFRLSEEDVAVLRPFLREAKALELLTRGWGGIPASYRISFRVGEPLEIGGKEPSPEQRAALLHHLRPFLLENEPISFHVVRGILARSSESTFLIARLRQIKDRFKGAGIGRQFRIDVGDMVLTSEATLNQWLNGFEYHRDLEKSAALIDAHDPVPVDSSRPIFVMMLSEKTESILLLAHIVNMMLSEPLKDSLTHG